MNFEFSAEQTQLRASLRAYLAAHNNFDQRMAASRSEAGWNPALWDDLAGRLGILGAALPVEAGGLGGTAVDRMIILEELGESLALTPYIDTVAIAGDILAATGNHADLLRGIVRGQVRIAFAWNEPDGRYRYDHVRTRAETDTSGWRLNGVKSVVVGAPWATHFLVSARVAGGEADADGVALFLVARDAPGITMTSYATIDGGRAADLRFDRVVLGPAALVGTAGGALPLIERAGDVAIAAIGAEAVGVLRRLLQDTIDYCRQRRQFGQPLADFQVLQHRMVDMFLQLELATSAVYLVTLCLNADAAARARAASTAKVTIANACCFVGESAVQLHGGMGMTDELPLGYYFKRATMIASEFGSADYHLGRYARLMRAA